MSGRGWPRYVFKHRSDPDYRFSLANERTFLAWIRTALALVAAGMAVDFADLALTTTERRLIAICLVGLGLTTAMVAWIRWASAERALRRSAPLPSLRVGALLTLGPLGASVLIIAARL